MKTLRLLPLKIEAINDGLPHIWPADDQRLTNAVWCAMDATREAVFAQSTFVEHKGRAS